MSGSTALNLCGIAGGRLDIFYDLGFGGPWYQISWKLIYIPVPICLMASATAFRMFSIYM
jgi:hypothetical protein